MFLQGKEATAQTLPVQPVQEDSPAPAPVLEQAIAAPADEVMAAQTNAAMQPRAFIPLVSRPSAALVMPTNLNDVPAHINYLRAAANVPAVIFDTKLADNCWLHSRYMAEENAISHDENASSKWYSAAGQACAKNGNVWLGGEYTQPYWEPSDSVEGWIGSVGHRMWMLYPTTPVFGFGFYSATNNRAGASLDVLTKFSAGRDSTYASWPVRYPGANQQGIPASKYVITLGWPYSGPAPTVSGVTLTSNGNSIANTVTTSLPVGHKGILITPSQPLPANSTINVSVSGSYNGQAFSYAWSFTTGN